MERQRQSITHIPSRDKFSVTHATGAIKGTDYCYPAAEVDVYHLVTDVILKIPEF